MFDGSELPSRAVESGRAHVLIAPLLSAAPHMERKTPRQHAGAGGETDSGFLACRERMVTSLCAGRFLIIVAATLLAQATPELVRSFAGGDPQLAVRALTTMSSLHSLVEVFVNPVFGRLSDSYGRKPFLIASALLLVVFRTPVGLAPWSVSATDAHACGRNTSVQPSPRSK